MPRASAVMARKTPAPPRSPTTNGALLPCTHPPSYHLPGCRPQASVDPHRCLISARRAVQPRLPPPPPRQTPGTFPTGDVPAGAAEDDTATKLFGLGDADPGSWQGRILAQAPGCCCCYGCCCCCCWLCCVCHRHRGLGCVSGTPGSISPCPRAAPRSCHSFEIRLTVTHASGWDCQVFVRDDGARWRVWFASPTAVQIDPKT